jgi:Secretion system C-terminal sorting domain
MQRFILLVLAISGFAINSFSQTITTSSISGSPFCASSIFNVSYSITGSFSSGNVFKAQLSDANGNFTSPIEIGSVASILSGFVPVTMPPNQGSGAGYRIRIISSDPVLVGSVNDTDLTIYSLGISMPTFVGTALCAGQAFNIDYSIQNSCPFPNTPLNVFTAQLSDPTGSFAIPTVIGTSQSGVSGTINAIVPSDVLDGTSYRIRIVSSNPGLGLISPTNSVNLTINAYAINAPILAGNSFCQGEPISINYSVKNGCLFPSSNAFTAQLSNSTGSFSSPINIGSVFSDNSGIISATIPAGTLAGTAYRIRVVSSNPTIIVSPDNGSNITVNASVGNPAIFGSNTWNVYAYAGTAAPISINTYLGTYTEDKLSFDTNDRWVASTQPSAANASSGLAYTGCPVFGSKYSISFKRTNFICGYYQIDIPFQDEWLTLFVNGVQVFQNNDYTGNLQSNVWTGFLGSASTVEFQLINFDADGQLKIAFNAAPSPLVISDPTFVCSSATTSLKASSSLPLTYAWTPTANLTPSNGIGANVTAALTATTTYTVTGTDLSTGCSVSGIVTSTVVTPATIPTISITSIPSTICSGVTTSTLKASGANTYTWSPSTGLSSTTGNIVTANPTSNTTYTVTGSTGCQSATNTATVTVQPTPISPSTVFGSGTWNVYCHNNTSLSDYYGYYTENNLNIKTASRWTAESGPSTANSSSGLAYSGCTVNNAKYSMSFKRTNFICDYYQIDIPYQDDGVKLLINGVQVFQNNSFTPSLQTNVWTGFLYPSATVEIQFVNLQFSGQLEVLIGRSPSVPQTVNSDITICPGSTANLSATSSISGATYSWFIDNNASGTITFSPNAFVANPQLQTTSSTPLSNYMVTNILTDVAGTGCTTSKNFIVTVANIATTAVNPISPTNFVTDCTNVGVTLTASGANTYTWSPSTGLSSTSGFSVIAKPLVTTTYTVSGSNNCTSQSASTTVTVSSVPLSSSFPTGTWNVYGFNSTSVGADYQGFYTENGTGPSGLNFDTRTRWSSNDVPSNANSSSGITWQGCPMNSRGTSLSFKRSGFACGLYQIDVPSHIDGFSLLINNTKVAEHNGGGDNHNTIWTGILNSNSTVEWQLVRNGNRAYLQANFTLITQPSDQSLWTGSTNNDWFNSANWCNGIPTAATDVLIPAAGVQNMPVINAAGAVVRNLIINPAIPSGVFTTTIPAATLTMNAFNLDVYGSWTNNGAFIPNAGTVNFVGARSGNIISSSSTQTFNNITINNSNGITISSGVHLVSGVVTLTKGIITQNATLKIMKGASVSGATNASYIEGSVSKIGNTAFTFPVGKGDLYRPISITAPVATTDEYRAQYFNVNPNGNYPIAQRASTLDRISAAEYWILDRIAGTSNVSVTLSLGSNSEDVTNLNSLKVAVWNGSLWTDQGNGGANGTTTAGAIISARPLAVYGPVTIGDKLTVGLEDSLPTKADLSIYPNPAINSASIELNGALFSLLSITNSVGQEINCHYSVGSSKVEIDTSNLTSGLYVINLFTNQKPSKIKLLIQR